MVRESTAPISRAERPEEKEALLKIASIAAKLRKVAMIARSIELPVGHPALEHMEFLAQEAAWMERTYLVPAKRQIAKARITSR